MQKPTSIMTYNVSSFRSLETKSRDYLLTLLSFVNNLTCCNLLHTSTSPLSPTLVPGLHHLCILTIVSPPHMYGIQPYQLTSPLSASCPPGYFYTIPNGYYPPPYAAARHHPAPMPPHLGNAGNRVLPPHQRHHLQLHTGGLLPNMQASTIDPNHRYCPPMESNQSSGLNHRSLSTNRVMPTQPPPTAQPSTLEAVRHLLSPPSDVHPINTAPEMSLQKPSAISLVTEPPTLIKRATADTTPRSHPQPVLPQLQRTPSQSTTNLHSTVPPTCSSTDNVDKRSSHQPFLTQDMPPPPYN